MKWFMIKKNSITLVPALPSQRQVSSNLLGITTSTALNFSK